MPGWVLVAVLVLGVAGILANWRADSSRPSQVSVASS
jgi:hypothetical protein